MEAAFHRQPEPGKWLSALFSLLMHGLLALCLFYGVQWQRREPEAVMVELVRSLPAHSAQPAPVEESPPPPRPEPKPVVKAEPEPPKPVKPDIALKEPKPEKKPEKPKEPPKVEPKKPEVKPDPKAARSTETSTDATADRMSKLLNQETSKVAAVNDKQRLNQEIDRVAKQRSDLDASAARQRASNEWGDRIRGKVRNNISLPPNLTGRPKAEFEIDLLPDGSVANEPRLLKSSGIPALDDAIQRAILKSSPLPLPGKGEVFERKLKLIFDPLGD